LWSWHVVEFLEFADATIEILDGWPTLVEQDVRGWIDNTGGIIGFWEYTVTAELHSVREPGTAGLLSLLPLALAVVAISRGKSEVIGADARGPQWSSRRSKRVRSTAPPGGEAAFGAE
jgi:hypothetical protein